MMHQGDLMFKVSFANLITKTINYDVDEELKSMPHCEYAGIYTGTFTGDGEGPILLVTDAQTGGLKGVMRSPESTHSVSNTYFYGALVDLDWNPGFIAIHQNRINYYIGLKIIGDFTTKTNLSGLWLDPNSGYRGAYSTARVGYNPDAVYRFTTKGGTRGLSLEINRNNKVTGILYTGLEEGDKKPVIGTLSEDKLSAVAGDTEIHGTVNFKTLTIKIILSFPSGGSSYTINGCEM